MAFPHGTTNGYGNLGCRCAECREANRIAHGDYMERRKWEQDPRCPDCGGPKTPSSVRCQSCDLARRRADHGTEGRYHRGCRCSECREAATKGRRARRHANLESTRAYWLDYYHRRGKYLRRGEDIPA